MTGTSSFAVDLRCPDDGHLLRVETRTRVPFAVCRHCDGIWFTRDAIQGDNTAALPDASKQQRKDAHSKGGRACPQCAVKLDVEHVDDVAIDVCPKCGGVWLDPGEYRAARLRTTCLRLEQEMPSLRPKKSVAGMALERVLDLIESIEEFNDELEVDETAKWRRLRRKPSD